MIRLSADHPFEWEQHRISTWNRYLKSSSMTNGSSRRETCELISWKMPDRQTDLGFRIHWAAAWHLLLRETTFQSQVLMESTYVYRNRAGRVSVGFVSRSLPPGIRLGWAIVILNSRGRHIRIRQILLYLRASLKGNRLECDYNHLCRKYYVYIEENTDLIIYIINGNICFSISKVDVWYFRKCSKLKELLICISINFLYLFQLFKKFIKVRIQIIK